MKYHRNECELFISTELGFNYGELVRVDGIASFQFDELKIRSAVTFEDCLLVIYHESLSFKIVSMTKKYLIQFETIQTNKIF